jgi:hypothetical protein
VEPEHLGKVMLVVMVVVLILFPAAAAAVLEALAEMEVAQHLGLVELA